ncbi:MAG: hypothetical protein IJD48_01110 [Clostridia bacterium]|nr:hypothetical protein [Clostridia bacterium]
MNEFAKFKCACDTGYDKGVLKKTIENNIFTIFGNLNHKNSIVIRYHGCLTENNPNNSTTFNMFYFFDDNVCNKKIIELQKCTKCGDNCYCTSIDLDTNNKLSFGFFNSNNEYELNKNFTFNLDIALDPITNIMQRYGFEQNTNLPVCEKQKENMFIFKHIMDNIKIFFANLFGKTTNI